MKEWVHIEGFFPFIQGSRIQKSFVLVLSDLIGLFILLKQYTEKKQLF